MRKRRTPDEILQDLRKHEIVTEAKYNGYLYTVRTKTGGFESDSVRWIERKIAREEKKNDEF